MSRSSFLTPTKETDLRYHHGHVMNSRSNDNSISKTTIARHNPKTKRNLRDKRRATGIQPNDVPLTSTSTEGSANDDNEEEEEEEKEKEHHDQTLTPTKPIFTVNRIQTNFENLSIARPTTSTKHLRPEDFRLHRVEKQTSDDDPTILKERIHALESILYEKDNYIHDLQQKLTHLTQNLTEAEEQICKLHQDKLTLIKAFSTVQENKPSIKKFK